MKNPHSDGCPCCGGQLVPLRIVPKSEKAKKLLDAVNSGAADDFWLPEFDVDGTRLFEFKVRKKSR